MGSAVMLGGGFEDFTQNAPKSQTNGGGSWNLRLAAGTLNRKDLEEINQWLNVTGPTTPAAPLAPAPNSGATAPTPENVPPAPPANAPGQPGATPPPPATPPQQRR